MPNLIATALLFSFGVRASDGHRAGSVDKVSVQVNRHGLIALAGLEDWALALDGGVVCPSEPGVFVVLTIEPADKRRSKSKARTGPTANISQLSLLVGTLEGTSLPHVATGHCLVSDNRGFLRELQFELNIAEDGVSPKVATAVRQIEAR